jgi:hypothetical protein
MPNKILLKLALNPAHNHIALQRDGDAQPRQLNYVRAIKVSADAEGDQSVELTLYTNDFQSELEVSDATAEVILRNEAIRAFSFIDTDEEHELRKLRAAIGGQRAATGGASLFSDVSAGIAVLDRFLLELERRRGLVRVVPEAAK